MKNILLALLFIFSACAVCARGGAAEQAKNLMPAFTHEKSADILDEGDDIKKLVLKYDAAPQAQKAAVRKEIETLETENENTRIKKNEERIKRQEEKIKELKALNEKRKKNIKQTVAKKVDYLVRQESAERIKNEPPVKKSAGRLKENR
jgi:predicted RNase H-like nuclease (RuvC/YqgF family)